MTPRPWTAVAAVMLLVVSGAGEGRTFCAGCAATDWPAPVRIAPESMGIELAAGPMTKGKGEAVTTHDKNSQPVVGRLYVAIGTGALILLPDGQIVARKKGEFAPTDRKFEPADKKVLAEQLVREEFPGFKTKQTNHYLYIYDTSEDFALATSRILETMLPGVILHGKAMQIDVKDPQLPLVVVMFKSEAEFQQYQRMPPGVVAYYQTLSNRVFMYEQSRLADVRPDLAVQQALATIAHEGAHQILHNIGVQQRLSLWPMWLSEGMAEYFAPTQAGERLRWKGAGQVNDLRMFELEQYVKSRATEKPDGQLIEHTTQAARLTSTGYASAWALTHYLAKNKRAEFNEYVKKMSQLGPLETSGPIVQPGLVRENLVTFQMQFGENLTELENRLVLHLKKQNYNDPFAQQPHYVATVQAGDAKRPIRMVNTFHSTSLAEKWIRDTVDQLPEAARSRADSNVRIFPNRAAAEQWAKQFSGK
ncbi:DUF1570 domain-containing protein [Anatilimnocola floriformis]|uniref:DUF1570 domain-containing protein n=1 Tax=Anatilimnocola floriformis TaxID=2948575 RepID=UPI0020C4D388|nr:DUF1570 domain-containing protein [Anatilimnocola floriformis]